MNENKKITHKWGCGCFSTIAGVFIIWALIFGITVDNKHYGISCSCSKGIDIASP